MRAGLWFSLIWLAQSVWAKPVDMAQVVEVMPLVGAMAYLEDASATLSAEQALHASGWADLAQREKKNGVTESAFWLRLTLHNSGDFPLTRWLAAGSTLTQNVMFFQFDSRGHLLRRVQAGYHFPLANRPVNSGMYSLLDVALAPNETQTVLIRLQTNNTLILSAQLWEPLAYREYELNKKTSDMMLISMAFTVGLFLFLAGGARRDWILLSVGGWLLCYVLYEFVFFGYAYQHFFSGGNAWLLLRPTTFAMLAIMFFIVFMYFALQLDQHPVLKNVMHGAFVAFGAIPFVMLFDAHLAVRLANVFTMLFLLVGPVLIISFWRRRARYTAALLLASLSAAVFMGQRLLYLLGLLPYSLPQVDWVSFASVSLIGFLMLLGFTQRIAASYREKIVIQDQLIFEQAQKQSELEAAVQQRTRALHKALIDADEANRAKSYFLAKVSHDLKSPLTSILGYSQQISAFQHAEVARKSSIIYKSARRLLALVSDLIDYATGERDLDALHPKPTYALDFFNSVAQEAQALAKINQNRFVFTQQGHLPKVLLMDTKRLHQVLINVLSNACKFTHQGEVRFVIQADLKAQGRCELQMRIEDNGCGIEAEQLGHIFEPFTKYNQTITPEGIGLGLAIAKQWLDAMNATIVVDSEQGKGTQVCIKLSLASVEEDSLSAQDLVIEHHDLPWFDGQGKRVWLIEDSALILQLLDSELRVLNIDVVALSDGQQALALIAQTTQAPDLIVTDFHLPGADGQQILQAARARWPTLEVVLISAAWHESEQQTALMPFSAHLLKPIDLVDFRLTLAGLLKLAHIEPTPPVNHSNGDALALRSQQTPWQSSWTQTLRKTLSEQQKQALCQLISLNAVTDIMDWACALKADNPALNTELDELIALARNTDLNALQTLATGLE